MGKRTEGGARIIPIRSGLALTPAALLDGDYLCLVVPVDANVRAGDLFDFDTGLCRVVGTLRSDAGKIVVCEVVE